MKKGKENTKNYTRW